MGKVWIADNEPHPTLTLYTRSNVGEVFPNVITLLTATLIADAVQSAQVEGFVETGGLRPEEAKGESVATGVFGGYLYMSGSTMRLFGTRMPGMAISDIDAQILGEVEGLPTYVRRKGDRNLLASVAMLRYSIKLMWRPDISFLDGARVEAQQWLLTLPDLDGASDSDLMEWLQTFPPRQKASMKRVAQTAMLVGAPRGMIDQLLQRFDAPPGLANRIVSGTGDVDSARLAQRLWSLGRIVTASRSLGAAFDSGLDGIAERISGSDLEHEIASFLADHGHRGNDEYELATLAWVMDSRPVYAAIDRLRHAPNSRDPAQARTRLEADAGDALAEACALLPRPARRVFRHLARVARLGSIARERAKDILVLENLGARRVLHELVRRAADRGGPSEPRLGFCVTMDELAHFVAEPTTFADVIAERSELESYLNARIPPPWFDGVIPDPSTWELRTAAVAAAPEAGTEMVGIAVSGGVASGRARVIVEPSDPRGLEPGDVLVCGITDPSWTPLFLGAVAVACETGAIQSHAAIVARELGIPAVMSVPGITSVADGTMMHVDGTKGIVRVG